jgi:hypothetical protein
MGSPEMRLRSYAQRKKLLRIEMFFARVPRAAVPHVASMNSSIRSMPSGGVKSGRSRSAK